MTSLKSIMKRRSLQVLDTRAMTNLKGGKKGGSGQGSGGNPNPGDGEN